jgi:O-acetyl-ADP-ribose deacetylase (regulator of RNase III)
MSEPQHHIIYSNGDLFKVEVEALVNPVNCVGVMGKGLALAFKEKYPYNFQAYKEACDNGEVQPGKMLIVPTTDAALPNLKYIVNFPTKRHFRDKSKIEDIEIGLVTLVAEVKQHQIKSIAIPALGSGLGGLKWSAVQPRIESAFADLTGITVIVFPPKTSKA